jgi:hypothetical protein
LIADQVRGMMCLTPGNAFQSIKIPERIRPVSNNSSP